MLIGLIGYASEILLRLGLLARRVDNSFYEATYLKVYVTGVGPVYVTGVGPPLVGDKQLDDFLLICVNRETLATEAW